MSLKSLLPWVFEAIENEQVAVLRGRSTERVLPEGNAPLGGGGRGGRDEQGRILRDLQVGGSSGVGGDPDRPPWQAAQATEEQGREGCGVHHRPALGQR